MWHRRQGERVDAEAFEGALAGALHVSERCGGEWLQGPVGRAAGGQRLDRADGPGWCAVGDAAMAFDPISSMGVYTALVSAVHGVGRLRTPGAAGWQQRMGPIWSRYRSELARLQL